jgi:hypothetical protein
MPTPETSSVKLCEPPEQSRTNGLDRAILVVPSALFLVALWAITHRYKGVQGDAELYAFQALARINPTLSSDLFLRDASQDRYTIFSPLYAWCISPMGLRNAALVLTVACKVWFLTAAAIAVRALCGGYIAFFTVALLILIPGGYGAYDIFQYSEDWLTARSLAEALTMTGLAFYLRGSKSLGMLIAIGAVFVHPLMGFPGVLVLLCLWLPLRISMIGALLGIVAVLAICLNATILRLLPHPLLSVMDTNWLEIVRERSQFLFLETWRLDDWKLNVRPFVSLTLSTLALTDLRLRKLCVVAALIGATGLLVGFISGSIGPVVILLQGQAWRWLWITAAVSVLVLAPTLIRVWQDEKCGPLCAILIAAAWTFSQVDGSACIAVALLLWLVRDRITLRIADYLRLAAVGVGVIVVVWIIANCHTIISSSPPESGRELALVQTIRNVVGVDGFSIILVLGFWVLVKYKKSTTVSVLISLILLTGSALALPGAFKDFSHEGTAAEIAEFSEWRAEIPPGSNVFVAPAYNSASFVWFTLGRAGYLSVDQSSGVVFSRATALEVRRRSDVLGPAQDPDWRLQSDIKKAHGGPGRPSNFTRPLTREILVSICSDPQLNFVVAKESIGFGSIPHLHSGKWKNWNLYSCKRVHALASEE